MVALVFSGGAMDITPLLQNPGIVGILLCGQPSVQVVGAGDALFGRTLDGRAVAPAGRMSLALVLHTLLGGGVTAGLKIPPLCGIHKHNMRFILFCFCFAGSAAVLPSLTIDLLPPAVPSSGLFIANVSFSGGALTFPTEDVISLHCVGEASAGASFPVSAPSGSFLVPLARGVQCGFEFRYLRSIASGDAEVAAAARVPALGADNDPVGTRIAFGDAPGDMIFTFTSMTNSTQDPAYVAVSLTPGGPYVVNVTAVPSSYSAEDLCHAPANTSGIASYLFPGYFHKAVLQLEPATRYYATYGHAHGVPAPETSFRTRAPPSPETPTRFAAFGDSALYPVFPGSVTTIDTINAIDANVGEVDFVAVAGDLGYAEGSTLLWALWAAFTFPVASRIPFMVSVGNHEVNVAECFSRSPLGALALWQGPTPQANAYGDDSGGEGGVAAHARYAAPSNGLGVFWYSFDAGNVHFVHFSSEHDYTPGSQQRAFLERDLGAVDRAATPWLVVAMHRPMYNARNDSDWVINEGMRAELEALFLASKVDLVLSGHYHNYLRTTPLANMTVMGNGEAPVYITVGTGGATYHQEAIRSDAGQWVAAQDVEWGFLLVETANSTALRATFRSNALGGAVKDEVWIHK